MDDTKDRWWVMHEDALRIALDLARLAGSTLSNDEIIQDLEEGSEVKYY